MKHRLNCQLGFGDCPDCVYFIGGGCEYKEDEIYTRR